MAKKNCFDINTDEIPGELSRENMISLHAKRSLLLSWPQNKSSLSLQKTFKRNDLAFWHFIDVYVINRTLHGRSEIGNFSSSVEKYFTSERTM